VEDDDVEDEAVEDEAGHPNLAMMRALGIPCCHE
jgi:hypothetical protein